jgi:hypothetical protein
MTPRVRHFVSRVPDPETFHWFDLGALPRQPVDLGIDARLERLITHLPFAHCALVFADADGHSSMLALWEGASSVTVAGLVDVGGHLAPIEPLGYTVAADGIRVVRMKGAENTEDRHQQAMVILAVLEGFLRTLDARGYTCWRPKASGSFLNKRRAAKGKPPAAWVWRTVIIDPARDNPADGGETPAASRGVRAHDRRGHWRRLSKDRIVWVRACRVGKPSLGAVFHDYRLSEGGGAAT